MKDIELAASISPEIEQSLSRAKAAAEDFPEHCLVRLRALCKQVCVKLIDAKALAIPRDQDLVTLINEVAQRLKPAQSIKKAFHALRDAGNWGAHPEKFNHDASDWARMALESQAHAIIVLQFAHTQIYPEQTLPDPIDSAPISHGLKTLSYKATIEEEPDAQFLIAQHFWDKVEKLARKEVFDWKEQNIELPEAQRKACYWYELASKQDHAQSKYAFGRLLISGIRGNEFVRLGVNEVFGAARLGNADANAYVGQIYYEGLHDQPQDFVESRKYFEQAANEDHPAALMMLGIMLMQGEGGPIHPQAAFEYTCRSAEAGYPIGQYNLFVHYWESSERNEEEALLWLQKSASQGFPAALNVLAHFVVKGKIPGKSLEDARDLLETSMTSALGEQHDRNEAAYRSAELIANHFADLPDLTAAADRLQRCYEAEKGEGALADACVELTPKVLERIKELIKAHKGSADEIAAAGLIVRIGFDENGKPRLEKSVGLDKFREDLKAAALAKKQLSAELYQARLADTFFPELAERGGQRRLRVVPVTSEKIGRNDPCPCGSGKKYKKCCEA